MKKWLIRSAAVLAAALTALGAAEEVNLLVNGDFSQGLKGWRFENSAIAVNPALKVEGKTAVTLPGKSEIRQNVAIKDKTSYRLTYRVKGDNVQAADPRKNGVRFMLNANKRWLRATPKADGSCLSGTFDWTAGEFRFSSDQLGGAGRMTLKLVLDCDGVCHVADVKLVEVAAK